MLRKWQITLGDTFLPHTVEHIATKFQRLPLYFRDHLSSTSTADVMGRRCVLEIQDGSQVTGSGNNFGGFTDIHVVLKTIQGFTTIYETSKSLTIMADATRVENPRWQPTNRK